MAHNPEQNDDENGRRERKETTVDNRNFYAIMLLLSLIAIWLIISAITGATDVETQPPDADDSASVEQTRIPAVAEEEIVSVDYPPEQFYITDQVIVSGQASVVSRTLDILANEYGLESVDRVSYGALLSPRPDFCPGLSDRANFGRDLVSALWSFEETEGRTVASIIRAIEEESEGVTAEPNRIAGTPWEIEGSPWEIEGSPWEIEGSSGASGDLFAQAEAGAAPNQWAFGLHGIELTGTLPTTDQKVLVGVFDTLPFSPTTGMSSTEDILWVNEPARLTLTAYVPVSYETSLPAGDGSGSGMVNHGLFVAGLVHGVAPNSKIELIRVLDESNRGDLFALNKATFEFMKRAISNKYKGAVMNMSLGIRIPPLEARGFAGLTTEVHSLRDLLAVARCSDIVVVAAAGNNSAKSIVPELPNLPAAWSSVIGVSASNINKGLSCFSNQGDIGAPGGDGRETDGPAGICRPRNNECLTGECPFGVIGPISRPEPEDTGYAYWTGSSFAAPMVSGLASLVLQETNSQLSPADVRSIIECGATPSNDRYLGTGIINVRRTLDVCLPRFEESTAN